MFTIQVFKRCTKCGQNKPATREFWRTRGNGSLFCARICRSCGDAIEASKPRVSLVCIHCKESFTCAAYVAARSKRRFCSNRCAALWRYSDDLVERFWSRVEKGDPDSCWAWRGSRNTDGYGFFSVAPSRMGELPFSVPGSDRPRVGRGVSLGAHRVAVALTTGSWPDLHVLHVCDNPPCCNPRHLRLGTHVENMRDRQRKGRHAGAIFDSGKVRKIRKRAAAGEHYAAIARSMGVDPEQVRRVIAGDRWRYVS